MRKVKSYKITVVMALVVFIAAAVTAYAADPTQEEWECDRRYGATVVTATLTREGVPDIMMTQGADDIEYPYEKANGKPDYSRAIFKVGKFLSGEYSITAKYYLTSDIIYYASASLLIEGSTSAGSGDSIFTDPGNTARSPDDSGEIFIPFDEIGSWAMVPDFPGFFQVYKDGVLQPHITSLGDIANYGPGEYVIYYYDGTTLKWVKVWVMGIYIDVNRDGELVDDLVNYLPGSRIAGLEYQAGPGHTNFEITVDSSGGNLQYQSINIVLYPINASFLTNYTIDLELLNTSNHSGICGNFPSLDDTNNYYLQDFSFSDGSTDTNNLHIDASNKDLYLSGNKVITPLWCKDFAAKTDIQVTYTKITGGISALTPKSVPIDSDNDDLADVWESNNGLYVGIGPNEKEGDSESMPEGRGVDGDMLKNWEEYRGFFVVDPDNINPDGSVSDIYFISHIRGDPLWKDLFVYNHVVTLQRDIGLGNFQFINNITPSGPPNLKHLNVYLIIDINSSTFIRRLPTPPYELRTNGTASIPWGVFNTSLLTNDNGADLPTDLCIVNYNNIEPLGETLGYSSSTPTNPYPITTTAYKDATKLFVPAIKVQAAPPNTMEETKTVGGNTYVTTIFGINFTFQVIQKESSDPYLEPFYQDYPNKADSIKFKNDSPYESTFIVEKDLILGISYDEIHPTEPPFSPPPPDSKVFFWSPRVTYKIVLNTNEFHWNPSIEEKKRMMRYTMGHELGHAIGMTYSPKIEALVIGKEW
jgi:hypothetical protein